MKSLLAVPVLLAVTAPVSAGLHYSGEQYRELPARWRGFLPDHRALRTVANPKAASPLREQYADAARTLADRARAGPLSADDAADLGALLIRLGDPKALDVLRPAARAHPDHFRLAANLGTAWQVAGDFDQAAAALEDAVRLAPDRWKDAEALHLKLVRLRLKEGKAKDPAAPDDLFGKNPPANALALAQQLALWLPADGRLLWQLGELADAAGDVRTAANVLGGCVTEFGMASPEVRARRQALRAAADVAEAAGHRQETAGFKSARPLARALDPARLPAVDPAGVNRLPWAVVGETEFGPGGKPAFLPYLADLDGKRVTIAGYMTPVGGAAAGKVAEFYLSEAPVGCWFCESPGPTQLVVVELPDGAGVEVTRGVVKVTGVVRLNRADPERFPVAVAEAAVGPAD